MSPPRHTLLPSLSSLQVRQHRILVVDDEPLNLQVFEFNFGDDFALIFAASAEEALGVLQSQRVSVVIADHRMPGMLGLDLLTWVADHRPEVVRILLTAHTDVPLLLDSVNRGILFRYIAKPWDADSMRQDMHLAIQRHLLNDENVRLLAVAEHNAHPPDAIASALVADLARVQVACREAAAEASEGRGSGEAARTAERLLDQLVGDARREAQRRFGTFLTLEPSEVALAALASERHRIAAAGVSIQTALSPEAPRFLGTRTGLIEALAALLRNAVEAAGRGPGRRLVELATAGEDPGWMSFRVTDSGPGFPAEIREAAPRTWFSTAGRSGLGLAVARSIAELHGGELVIHPGPGGSVSLRVPLRGGPR